MTVLSELPPLVLDISASHDFCYFDGCGIVAGGLIDADCWFVLIGKLLILMPLVSPTTRAVTDEPDSSSSVDITASSSITESG